MDGKPIPVVYTIGHSNHSIEEFVTLLRQTGVTAVADVRSVPFSRFTPQFDRPDLKHALKNAGIAYSSLGNELGARPQNPDCYKNGVALYERIAATGLFQKGLDRILRGARHFTVALMCTEKDPLDCHRNILVARRLSKQGVTIRHILADGRIEENEATEQRLLKVTGEQMPDFFLTPKGSDPLERAYAKRAAEIAYSEPVGEVEEAGHHETHDHRLYQDYG